MLRLMRSTLLCLVGFAPMGIAQQSRPGSYLEDLQAWVHQTQHGVHVISYDPKSTLERMGIKPKDIVVSVNGQSARTVQELRTVLFNSPVPITTVEVIRDGKPIRVAVPQLPPGASYSESGFGDLVNPWVNGINSVGKFGPRSTIQELGAKVEFGRQGMRIREIFTGSILPSQGVQPGDIVSAINDRPVRSAQEFELLVYQSSSPVSKFTVSRPSARNQTFAFSLRRALLPVQPAGPYGGNVDPGNPQAGYQINPWVSWLADMSRPQATLGQETFIQELGIRAIVETDGLRISGMENRCLARDLGLQAGDLLATFNGARVLSQGQFRNAVYGNSLPAVEIVGLRGNRRFSCGIRREGDRLVVVQKVRG